MKLIFYRLHRRCHRALHDGAAYEAFRRGGGWQAAIYRPADNQFAEWSEGTLTLDEAKALLKHRANGDQP